MKNTLLLLSLAVLSACTTFSKSECENMDWPARGAQAAMNGETLPDTLRYYNRTCMDDNGVTPDQALLQRGFTQELVYFCTPNNLHALGERGEVYRGTCPDDPKLKTAYREGRQEWVENEVYRLRNEVNDLKSQVGSLEDENSRLKSELDSYKR